jgi:dTDP-4-dehydrorhamnose 3,5-epimerase
MEVVLYDERPESSTRGRVFKLVMSEHRRRLLNIPAGIWHADRNIGQKDAVMINFPTRPYEHENPDKYRLPLDTDRIPHRFEDPRGG